MNMNMSICNPTSMMEAHSNSDTIKNPNMNLSSTSTKNEKVERLTVTTPFDGGSSLGGFANDHCRHSVTLEPNKTTIDALHGYEKNTVICKFSQKTMLVHPSQASSSKSLPFSLFNKCELLMSECPWNSNQNAEVKKDTNIANHDIIKGQWTPEEDRALVELVNQLGTKKWTQIARSIEGRIGKQCRERWNNHLQPNIRKGSWSLEEDMILIKGHQEFGTKWSKIAKRMCGRSENDIKNRWNATMRRQNCNKNNQGNYKGSMLHAYVKWVTATQQSAELLNKFSNKNNQNVFGCSCDDLALLLS
ncbi:myb proto-oncogene protein [Vigna unguiculata]|uniref:Myb proto-oncogene protein n=1 Tax=Vigna unguiculata TaxID=3917 RepID=A0A4D6M1W8_VIGUN|nr:myb proto-oncogene protein [Vigna unguiculata]